MNAALSYHWISVGINGIFISSLLVTVFAFYYIDKEMPLHMEHCMIMCKMVQSE